MLRFSDQFRLTASQAELDFVDIPLRTDIPLFLDPYALSLEIDPWYVQCHQSVVDYFQLVVNDIRTGNSHHARQLLSHLTEPNEIHFGFSTGIPAGRGIGRTQAHQLYTSLSESQAVHTGFIRDLEDCELLIPGIARDKISDATGCILKYHLIEYTSRQCELLGIPVRTVSAGIVWDSTHLRWRAQYAQLPVYSSRPIILVPKLAVRYDMAVDCGRYYRNFVLNYLKAEQEAAQSLTSALQTKVFKYQVREQYPMTKEFLYQFSRQHPDVLDRYKHSLPTQPAYLTNEQIENKQDDPREIDYLSLVQELSTIAPGSDEAHTYHLFASRALVALFAPRLRNPVLEQEINEGLKRIDIVFDNADRNGFFEDLDARHHVHCPLIIVECKNYESDPVNPEIDQIVGRTSPVRGSFGMLLCRVVRNKPRMLQRCKAARRDHGAYIIVLEDNDLQVLLQFKAEGRDAAIDEYLLDLFRPLIL
jgi:hypothetical protein